MLFILRVFLSFFELLRQLLRKCIFSLSLIKAINISLSDKGKKMDLSIQPIGASLRQNSAPKGPGGPPSHENVISQFGHSLTEEQRTSILAKVSELQESGASFDEVKYTVDTFLKETGIEPPSKGGTFIDTIT